MRIKVRNLQIFVLFLHLLRFVVEQTQTQVLQRYRRSTGRDSVGLSPPSSDFVGKPPTSVDVVPQCSYHFAPSVVPFSF